MIGIVQLEETRDGNETINYSMQVYRIIKVCDLKDDFESDVNIILAIGTVKGQ